jgi:hypothetical protein
MKPVMLNPNRASAHNHRGGTVRTFKRLFPVFPVLVLLAGVAMARPAAVTGTSHNPGVVVLKPQFRPSYDNPRFYFGTVVRDTADEDRVGPGPGGMPRVLQQQVQPDAPRWNLVFAWSWLSLLLVSR